jgi:hypothetical protein
MRNSISSNCWIVGGTGVFDLRPDSVLLKLISVSQLRELVRQPLN